MNVARIERLAGWLGLEGGFFMDFAPRFRRDLRMPHTLDRVGVEGDFALSAMAVVDPSARTNPRMLGEAEAHEIYDRALNGRLG